MAYTLNTNFIKAMGRATVEPVVHCSIALSGTTMDFHNSPEALDSTVTGDPLLGEVTSISQSVDPVSRKVQHGEMTFTIVDDGKIRGLVSTQSFSEKVITVKLGSTGLALSDFVGIFKGPIVSVIPQEGAIVIKAASFTHQFKGVKTYRTYIGDHPFSVVSQMLQDCGVAAGDIDSASFTPSNHADISHYNYSSFVFYNSDASTPPGLSGGVGVLDDTEGHRRLASQEVDIEDFVNESMKLTRSTLVHDPASGDIKIVRYDSTASVTKHFTTDEYTDFQQVDSGQGIITEVKTALAKTSAEDILIQSDATAATNLGASDYSHTIGYLSGTSIITGNSLAGSSTALTAIGGEGGITGTRGLTGTQPADAAISSGRPWYAVYRQEVLKSTTAFTSNANFLNVIHSLRDHDGDLTGSTEEAPIGLITTLVSRPFAGTEADGVENTAVGVAAIVDVTPAFDYGSYLLNRFSNTCPKLIIFIGLEHLNLEIGDLVSLDNDLFLSTELGLDGLDSGVKFEITKREVMPLGDSVGIELELTYATKTSAPSVTIATKPPAAISTDFGRVPKTSLMAARAGALNSSVLDNQTNTLAVTATSGLGISIAGGLALASGTAIASNSAHTLTMTASKHTYLGLNMLTGGIISQEVATSAEEPSLAAGELRLGKVITNGSAVTSIEDLRNFGSVSIEQIDKQALHPGVNRMWNPSFDIWPDPGKICPAWSVSSGVIGTDFKRSGSATHSGRYNLRTLDTSTVVTAISDKVPVDKNKPYRAAAWVYQDSSHAITLKVYWWKTDRSASSTASSTVYSASPTDSEWVNIGGVVSPPSDAAYASIELSRAASPGDEGFWDDVSLTVEPVSFSAYISSDQTPSTQAKIDFDTEAHDYGGVFDHGNQRMIATEGGVYSFTISLKIEPSSNSKGVTILIRKNATAYNNGTEIKTINLGDIATGDTGHEFITYTEQAIELAKDDTISAFITFISGQPVIAGTAYDSSFSGRKLS
mgnify:CR=1 FL=1